MAQQIQFSEEQEVVIHTKMRKNLVEFFFGNFCAAQKGLAGKWFQRDPCSRIKVLKLEDGINVLQPGVTGSKMDEAHTGCDQRFEFPSVSQRACNLYSLQLSQKDSFLQ